MTLRIVADENMPNVEAWFAPIAKSIVRKPGRTLTADDLRQADVLLVRSVTQVNADLLADTPVRFVGSATIGTDHVDQSFLAQQNIPFYYAPGCNAQSVTDWLLAVLARLHLDAGLEWRQKVIAVVGVGNVGSKVAERLERLGCRVLRCDPLRHQAGSLPEHIPLETALAMADIVCLHAPHTRVGDFPTDGMIGAEQLAKMRDGSWLINAGRGPVVQQLPLLAELTSGRLHAVLDVWPHEPEIDEVLLDQVTLASPHVAGYSLEGKFTGTQMLAQALAGEFALELSAQLTTPSAFELDVELYREDEHELWLSKLLLAVYDPARDTTAMRCSVQGGKLPASVFDAMRKEYPTRRELASVAIKNCPKDLIKDLHDFGFHVCQP